MDLKSVEILAIKFRNSIEGFNKHEFSTSLGASDFPAGCCDDASLLLAAYLSDRAGMDCLRIHGRNGGTHNELGSHVWLEHDNIIIDITADQFDAYGLSAVIVTSASKFHATFDIEEGEIELADFRKKFANDPNWLSTFKHDYERILDRIED